MEVFARYYSNGYDFMNLAPDRDLKNRGFDLDSNEDGLTYFYREDGIALFDIIMDYTRTTLTAVYGNEEGFLKDVRMKNFIEFCQTTAKIPGFPTVVKTIEEMARVLATLIWTLTAYHNLSFAIEHLDCFIPFRPACVQKPFPIQDTTDVPLSYLTATLPYPKKCMLILLLNNIVTLRTVPTLIDLPNPFTGNDNLSAVYDRFRANLTTLSKNIQERNAARKADGKRTWEYLDPANVEGSLSM
jgi:hypothetical protein